MRELKQPELDQTTCKNLVDRTITRIADLEYRLDSLCVEDAQVRYLAEELGCEILEEQSLLSHLKALSGLPSGRAKRGRKPQNTEERDLRWCLKVAELESTGALIKDAIWKVATDQNVSWSTVKKAWDKYKVDARKVQQLGIRLDEAHLKNMNERRHHAKQWAQAGGFKPEPVVRKALFDAFNWQGPLPPEKKVIYPLN